jgi:hypothetical protein
VLASWSGISRVGGQVDTAFIDYSVQFCDLPLALLVCAKLQTLSIPDAFSFIPRPQSTLERVFKG